jgi:phage/plasmid-like protein (TIGR03299 family)
LNINKENNMAHMIDTTTGRPAIAYAGETPWHSLGPRLNPKDPIPKWTTDAGLGHDVLRAPVQFDDPIRQCYSTFDERHVLFRSDTGRPLAVVSKDYQVVQPAEVMQFFAELIDIGGFQMETAGALCDGKRIWALAKINDGAPIIGNDLVRPYVLLTTSYDTSLATTGKLTAIRVVCNNTLSAAINGAKSEIKVPHTMKFEADKMRTDLGIFQNSFEKWLIQTRVLAQHELGLDAAGKLTAELIAPTMRVASNGSAVDVTAHKGYQRIMELFDGGALGGDMAGPTKWGWLNAVTQFVDHERGRPGASRLNSAWFGAGDTLKSTAYELALA